MTAPTATVVVRDDRIVLASLVADRLVGLLAEETDGGRGVHVALTGGTMGIAVLGAVAEHPLRDSFDWGTVHLWFSDERFVARDDPERNTGQARAALLDGLAIPAENIHEPPAAGRGATLDVAARDYAAELARFPQPDATPYPAFDVCLLGMGPDGHVASLFPGRPEVGAPGVVLPIRDSPKPPPDRITFTNSVINASARVWLVVAGADKAAALAQTMAESRRRTVPAATVHGTLETLVFADADAAAGLGQQSK